MKKMILRMAAAMLIALFAGCGGKSSGDFDIVEIDGLKYQPILSSGDSSSRVDLVIMGDGYSEDYQDEFNEKVDGFVAGLLALEPFVSWSCGMNIWRINVISETYGIYDPVRRNHAETALDTRFAKSNEPQMYIKGDYEKALDVCEEARVPGHDFIYVFVPDPEGHDGMWTEASNPISYSSDHWVWGNVMAHELAHSMVGLADEYDCYYCDGTERSRYEGDDPAQSNLTVFVDRGKIKWGELIDSTTPLPTTSGDLVGAWEGAGHFKFGLYRPASTCIMKGPTTSSDVFCEPCRRVLEKMLSEACSE
jgi:hypothetical protein